MSEALSDGFVDRFERAPSGSGVLDGHSFGLKDLYHVKDRVAGCGNPTWAATHEPADADCPVLAKLLAAGARLIGTTHTDELAYSLNGENHHYGTPPNPAAPERIPGGSSSGSASVTAAGLADFAIGSDTGGSVRVPASYCGLYGIRTTHGAVDLSACMALAPSFDTCGWFAREPGLFGTIGDVLLPSGAAGDLSRWLIDPALFALCDPTTSVLLRSAVERLPVTPEPGNTGIDPERWKETFRILQAREIWQVHGDWIRQHQPEFGPGVRDRFQMAAAITDDEVAAMQPVRDEITSKMRDLLGSDGVLVLPTAPGPAPVRNWDPALLDQFRYRVIALTCIAGHAGLPQISLPAGAVDGAPVGLSLIGPRGADRTLLELCCSLEGTK